MIDGVTIVSEYTQPGSETSGFIFGELLLIFIIAAAIFAARNTIKDFVHLYSKIILGVVTFVIISVLGYMMYLGIYQHSVTETYYIVEIDDSVSFNEFEKHYEIISKDDGLYTVKILD